MIYRLLYVSTAGADLGDKDLEGIHRAAQTNNAANGLTGLLVFTGTQFMQLLEGPRDAVESTFAAICSDPRHHAVARLIAEPSRERSCPDWAMALRVVDAPDDGANSVFQVDDETLKGFLPDCMAPDLKILFQSFNTMKPAMGFAAA
jgi:hypothetical protein